MSESSGIPLYPQLDTLLLPKRSRDALSPSLNNLFLPKRDVRELPMRTVAAWGLQFNSLCLNNPISNEDIKPAFPHTVVTVTSSATTVVGGLRLAWMAQLPSPLGLKSKVRGRR
ncbi:hypothetical protein EVAR_21577_1 [Eumeta japonica]|uniref:Uncharacterized protein n=1 Tax=Eumeta variegata TaxID=151549 RepID=A0A4C1UXY4_EUMVA|nr:hypothetical protein EVAR_21577_1 [Eumeta japonica]